MSLSCLLALAYLRFAGAAVYLRAAGEVSDGAMNTWQDTDMFFWVHHHGINYSLISMNHENHGIVNTQV